MDRRGWLWKKKSSDKSIKVEDEKPVSYESVVPTLSSVAHVDKQDNSKNKNYVQISMESYTRMSGLEDQVVNLEDQLKALEAKLSSVYTELNNKDNLVKQHAKVAEEAVSGWEKADAEVVSLRCQLESVSLSKLTVDEKAAHLDDALKECMKQIRIVKEESEHKLQEVILMKSHQWEKSKLELEAQIDNLDEGLRELAGENAALLRSLQESSNKIVKLKEEKSEVEGEVELLTKNVQSKEKEISSLKYELHVISKELDIRNEEKNMVMRSAEVANKQHTEDVKNIAKLENECQRLRGLLRKKLPGAAALAQMKLEVESSHHVISAFHPRKTTSKSDNLQESEFLSKRLQVLEEETRTLKEALASSNAELQASKNLYAKTVGRLKHLEAERHQERSTHKAILANNYENSFRRIYSYSPSITSISDNGHEDPESPVESCATSILDHSDINRIGSVGKFENHRSETVSELMDDFLEVEKMACLSDNGGVPLGIISKTSDTAEDKKETSCLSSNQNCFDPTNKAAEHDVHMQDLEEKKLMLQENMQLLEELKAQLASSHKSCSLTEIQLKCMTESYKSLQNRVEELETENKYLKEKMDELKNDLATEKLSHHDALVRYKEIEEKMQRDPCSVCASNSTANSRKDKELAAAEKKLAECQETLSILGRQLQEMCPQIGVTTTHHSKRLQVNEKLAKPSYGWSNSYGSCNSNEIDHAEACSVVSDSQGVAEEFSSHNSGATSCLSDTEGNFWLNS
ncbi:filament-like plant protein 4 [Vigna unguiculata]|uniref:filament-like plant protein 4 n=1 Tax=Vigna unguiculata TaxID=3917 RepID=UPI001016E41C|nr:filament-like plant protein 4 [Vigna unguiculata]